MNTTYHREFTLTSAHFNGQESYDRFQRLQETFINSFQDIERVGKSQIVDDIKYLIREVHGHAFKVVVEIEGELDEKGILIFDEDLEALVMPWNNTNLSVHPDFVHKVRRATTEVMSSVLVDKIIARWPDRHFHRIEVVIWETPEIYARAAAQGTHLDPLSGLAKLRRGGGY